MNNYRKELKKYVTDKLNNSRSVDHVPITNKDAKDDQHVINIGISILETKYPEIGPGYVGGGFARAVANNDLMEAMGRADDTCAKNIRFFCILLDSFSPYHLYSYNELMTKNV